MVDELSSERVLTTEFANGVAVDKVVDMDQETKDHVGRTLLRLTLDELFEMRYMQVRAAIHDSRIGLGTLNPKSCCCGAVV